MPLGLPDGNNLKPALIPSRSLQAVRVADGSATLRAVVDGGRVYVLEDEVRFPDPLPLGFAREAEDRTVRVKVGGGAVDYLEEQVPEDQHDEAVVAAMLLAAKYGNPDPDVARGATYVGTPHLALVRGDDPSEAWRDYPRMRDKRRKPLPSRIVELRGRVRVSRV